MGETRRKQILEGLLQAVADHGLKDLNMSEVADAAGLSRGILHYYFRNKDEMIGALVRHLKETHFQDYAKKVVTSDDPWERLQASLFYPVITFGKQGASLARAWIEFWGLSNRHAEVRSFVLGLQQDLREHFRQVIEYGIAQGAFRRDADPMRLATLILGTLEGLMLQWHFDPEGINFAEELKLLEDTLNRALKP